MTHRLKRNCNMKYQRRVIFTLVISVFGMFSNCVMADASELETCPSKIFSKFLPAYLESASIQATFTHIPLRKIVTVDAEPEPEQRIVLLDKQSVIFPVIPGKERRVADGVEVTVLEEVDGIAKIKIEKPDTDYQVLYVFKFEKCWFLDEVQDYSL